MDKKLVAYFSASGVTKKLAERISKVVGADLYEIQPKDVYTEEDLNWMNENSRSSIEMKNKSFRPEIANKVVNMGEYDTIYVGFPIWWYVAPTIINTFLESYDLKGKTIIPFATSGESLIGNTNEELKISCKDSILKEGKRFDLKDSDDVIKKWIENL